MCLGIPGQIVEIIDEKSQMAMAEISGIRRAVNYAPILQEQAADLIGSWALIHVGFAMSRIDEDEAQKTLDALRALGEVEDELHAISQSEKLMSE